MLRGLIITVLLLLTTVGGSSCEGGPSTFTYTLESTAQKTSLQEAGSIIGVSVPAPTYLPKGYKIQEVYIELWSEKPTRSPVILLISDEQIGEKRLVDNTQRYEFQCKMAVRIQWNSQGWLPIKLPGDRVTIGESKGVILDEGDHNVLLCNLRLDPGELPKFRAHISASKTFSKRELVKVAESITQ